MHNSTPPRWKRLKSNLLLAAALVAASTGQALELTSLSLGDPHLDVIPRTTEDSQRIRAVTAPATDFSAPEAYETHPAGATTTRARSDDEAFSQHSANLSFEQELEFKLGNGLFKKIWVFSPSSTRASDGLGPLYNARSCQRCHLKDGRGHVAAGPDYRSAAMFLRVSVPGPVPEQVQAIKDYIGTAPDPTYGQQLQDFSAPGISPEYRLGIRYEEETVDLNGGETASLRRPIYSAEDLGYGPLHTNAMLSPRVAPPMIGLGLLEAIPTADILAAADPDDADGDGISGRANLVWSEEFQQIMLGRFGLKAGMPTVHEQSAAAFSGDIGISTPLFPAPWGECTTSQTKCRAAPHGNDDARGTEIDQPNMDLVTFYARNLAVPARRDLHDAQVLRGKELFYDSGCAACHRPKFVTHRLKDRPEHSFQLIWPYSDLLLHDMGEGLADHRPEARATGREWRTAPLWGIGLTQQVSPRATYLHDGRARSLLEAILWHGGEAQDARNTVVYLSPEDRADLIRFLESL
ncbi:MULTISPECIES: di-heme oxidoredictase family protein [Rhodobacterales]|uniref:di-heme oxidoreductase family protein n=1 Tax=Rhodobacterales TaxID=204455 RepID=UPI00237F51A9|nr:di-heme oxidoredictase family protein [Phaeobacter gallaeciensis]MDE4139888.1 di-heme oxidoredictase family protein [Phaeobacter gallaeciensis]MDE4148502.1 di-heme oxidoredictase family protein [Phaeobacter gallaeciensis]MDE4152553.1 di-heme oxidoredictase family protein [Phaeobacter gallaeciensis]MDE4228113.1 di-heme oxidoredictase family protein [Phaeobacter gallaeciensis]MDE4257017.1 di-heme oxidoredictase family protein [Phaeobacter gallaeciensis]